MTVGSGETSRIWLLVNEDERLDQMVKQVEKNTGEVPEKVLADAGYRAEGEFRKLEKKGVVALVSLGREGKPAPASKSSADEHQNGVGIKARGLAANAPKRQCRSKTTNWDGRPEKSGRNLNVTPLRGPDS